jgi:hypothetical protein
VGGPWGGGWMDGWMDGWMGGWMDGWVDGWVGGWMGGWMDWWVGAWVHGWVGGSTGRSPGGGGRAGWALGRRQRAQPTTWGTVTTPTHQHVVSTGWGQPYYLSLLRVGRTLELSDGSFIAQWNGYNKTWGSSLLLNVCYGALWLARAWFASFVVGGSNVSTGGCSKDPLGEYGREARATLLTWVGEEKSARGHNERRNDSEQELEQGTESGSVARAWGGPGLVEPKGLTARRWRA